MILSLVLALIFFGLGLLHFYWMMGGEIGFLESLPTKENGKRVLNPGKADIAMVGIGLSVFGIFYMLKSGLVAIEQAQWMLDNGTWIIPIIFLFRAVGDFNYVGFFKKVRKTEFAKWDTQIYSPLCLAIAMIGLTIHWEI